MIKSYWTGLSAISYIKNVMLKAASSKMKTLGEGWQNLTRNGVTSSNVMRQFNRNSIINTDIMMSDKINLKRLTK